MKDQITIKQVNKNNFDKFVELIGGFAKYQKLKAPDKKAMSQLKKDGLKENPKYEAYLGVVNGEFVGFVTTIMMYSTFQGIPALYIEDLFVLEDFRRKGVGQKLFEHCVKIAKKKKCCRLDWWGLKKSKSAISFYTKNKAKELDETYFRLEKDQLNKFSFSK